MRRVLFLAFCLVVLGCRTAPSPQPTPTATSAAAHVAATSTPPTPTPAPLLAVVRVGITETPALFPTPWQTPRSTDALLRAWLATTAARRADDGRLTPESATWTWDDDRTLRLTPTHGDFTLWHDALREWRTRHPYGTLAQDVRVDGESLVVEWRRPPLCAAVSTLLQWPVLAEPWPPTRTSGAFTIEPESATTWYLQARQTNQPDIRLALLDDPSAVWARGDLDLLLGDAWLYGQSPPPAMRAHAGDVPGLLVAMLLFNTERMPVDDVAVRRALWLALDREALYREAYEGEPHLVDALAPRGVVAVQAPAPDRQAAETLLDDAGWRDRNGDGMRENADGAPLRVQLLLPLSATDARWERLGTLLQLAWAQIGVATEVRYQRPITVEDKLHGQAWQVALVPFALPQDADIYPLLGPETDPRAADLNLTRYANADVQALAAEAAAVPQCDDAQRNALYTTIWSHIWRDVPFAPLFRLPERLFVAETIGSSTTRAWLDASLCRAGLC